MAEIKHPLDFAIHASHYRGLLMKYLIALTLTLSLLLCGSAYAQRSPEGIVNYENIYIKTSSGRKLSDAEFKDAVVRAGKAYDWRFDSAPDGRLIGSLTVNEKHTISVSIGRTSENFSITYKDSINMNYGSQPKSVDNPWMESAKASARKTPLDPNAKLIHPSYNVWVKTLFRAINQEFAKI